MNKAYKVLLMRCGVYDADKISGIIREGIQELGLKPSGKVMLKPNAVLAHQDYFTHAFTRKEFIDGILSALSSCRNEITEISLGERSGLNIPTRFCFRNAGYEDIIKKHKVKKYCFDEQKHVAVPLLHKDSLRRQVFIPKPVTETDFLINLPKFKAHTWSRLTLSLKNYIGLQDDRHRLVDHNMFLEQKIADLQEVIQSKFIAIDAIIAGEKMMLTPDPFPMGAIVMGTNSCAVDTVGCHMVNVDPNQLIHLKLSAERGYGPMDLNEIEIGGDFPLEELQQKNRNFRFTMEPIDEYFSNHENLRCTVGTFPEKHSEGYCRGGCPGALLEAVHIIHSIDPSLAGKMKKIHYVVGQVDKNLVLKENETFLFAGDCTQFTGKRDGLNIQIQSTYKTSAEINEGKTKSNDMLKKTFSVLFKAYRRRNKKFAHAQGCPVTISDHINYLSAIGKIKNVNFIPGLIFPVNAAYFSMRWHRFLNTFR